MSKKRNLVCLLIGKNKNWYGSWYVTKKDYSILLQEDIILYTYIRSETSIFTQHSAINIRLFRVYSCILLDVTLVENFFVNTKLCFNKLIVYNKFFKKNICLSVYFDKEFENAFYVANTVARLIEKRVKFRSKLIKLFLKKIKNNSSGVYVQCSGRINSVDMARVDKLYLGRLPLQSLNYFLSYSLVIANTGKGLQGIKAWICK